MTRKLLIVALVACAGLVYAENRFQRDTEDFPADHSARRVIDVGGCRQIGEVSKLSLMKVGPLGRVPASLILTRVQVKYEDQTVDTVLQSDSAFYYDFFRLNKPCVDQIILDGMSTHASREFRVRAELE